MKQKIQSMISLLLDAVKACGVQCKCIYGNNLNHTKEGTGLIYGALVLSFFMSVFIDNYKLFGDFCGIVYNKIGKNVLKPH